MVHDFETLGTIFAYFKRQGPIVYLTIVINKTFENLEFNLKPPQNIGELQRLSATTTIEINFIQTNFYYTLFHYSLAYGSKGKEINKSELSKKKKC